MQSTIPTWLCEIHLTINDLPETQLTDFKRICKEIGGKAVLIELPHGQHTQQPMLSVIRETHDIAQIHQQIATMDTNACRAWLDGDSPKNRIASRPSPRLSTALS